VRPLGDALAAVLRQRRIEPPDPRSPQELEYWLADRRLFSIERIEDTLAQLGPGDERERPALDRELELARLQADVQRDRPAGCWCLGLGGCGRVYLPPETDDGDPLPGWRTWCRCPDGRAQKCAFLAQKTALERARFQRIVDTMWGSIPEAFRGWSLETLADLGPAQRGLAARVADWLEGDRWLYLWGPTGRAKTGAAVGALAALVTAGQSGLFTDVRDLLSHLRTRYADISAFAASVPDRRWESLAEVDVLVLDDIGAERRTDWTVETLGQLIAHRHRRLLRTIVTSNLDLVDLGEHLGEARMTSRIQERCGRAGLVDCSQLPNLRLEQPR
jgi:DNA replication protein DnaC